MYSSPFPVNWCDSAPQRRLLLIWVCVYTPKNFKTVAKAWDTQGMVETSPKQWQILPWCSLWVMVILSETPAHNVGNVTIPDRRNLLGQHPLGTVSRSFRLICAECIFRMDVRRDDDLHLTWLRKLVPHDQYQSSVYGYHGVKNGLGTTLWARSERSLRVRENSVATRTLAFW
jgi:hypothetical protein